MPRSFLVALLAVLATGSALAQDEAERPRNVILMIPDGFGPASLSMARLAAGAPLALDAFLTGSVGTASADNPVTDSGAAATAFAAGIKTYNGAIAVDTLRRPVGTVLQGARDRGMFTALVTTTAITHATPASFAAHAVTRADQVGIAPQFLENRVDLLLGGGLQFFLPEPGGVRTDGRDLLETARQQGYHLVFDAAGLRAAQQLPVLGLFAQNHMAYEVDRERDFPDEPSLAEMTRKALELLSQGEQGFFMMVEGGRIDHAAHANDPVGHLFDILAYDEAVRIALEFARADGRTLVVSASDHETGGLSIGRDGYYGFRPDVLLQATASVEATGREILRRAEEQGTDVTVDIIAGVIRDTTPISEFTDEDYLLFEAALDFPRRWDAGRHMMHVISRRALIGWTTWGHTGVDVTLHAYGPGSHLLVGRLENDEVGRIVAGLLEIDLEEVTRRVRAELELAEY